MPVSGNTSGSGDTGTSLLPPVFASIPATVSGIGAGDDLGISIPANTGIWAITVVTYIDGAASYLRITVGTNWWWHATPVGLITDSVQFEFTHYVDSSSDSGTIFISANDTSIAGYGNCIARNIHSG